MIYGPRFHIFFTLMVAFPDNASAYEYKHRKYVIVKFAELPKFYEELRPQNQQYQSEIEDWSKSLICQNIFGNKRAIDPEEVQYKAKLQRYSPAIFEELFREDETAKGIVKAFRYLRRKYVHDNSSKFRTFLVGGNERAENTFACVLRNSDETQFEMYFVSDYDYNVNDAPGREKFIGKFVFFGNQIYALAEESPPFHHLNTNVKKYYVSKRGGHKIAENWQNDPVCKLDLGRKIRLCTYVCEKFYSSYIDCEDNVSFQEQCTEKEYHYKNQSYKEWMLTCETMVTPSLTGELFVARGYTDNEVFVFKLDDELTLLFDLERVGVVIDDADRRLEG